LGGKSLGNADNDTIKASIDCISTEG